MSFFWRVGRSFFFWLWFILTLADASLMQMSTRWDQAQSADTRHNWCLSVSNQHRKTDNLRCSHKWTVLIVDCRHKLLIGLRTFFWSWSRLRGAEAAVDDVVFTSKWRLWIIPGKCSELHFLGITSIVRLSIVNLGKIDLSIWEPITNILFPFLSASYHGLNDKCQQRK